MHLITFPKCVIIMSSNRKIKSLNITNKKIAPELRKATGKWLQLKVMKLFPIEKLSCIL